MVSDAQTHLLPAEPAALDGVARLHGLEDGSALIAGLHPHVEEAERLFGELADDRAGRLSNDPIVLRRELAEFGFRDPEGAAARIAELRSGRVRSTRSTAARNALEAMLPELMKAIGGGPDQSRALNRFSDLTERLSSGVNL